MGLKVANVIEDGRFGGPPSQIVAVAEKLKYYGIETVVVLPQIDSDVFYKKLVQKDIHRRRLNLHRLTKQKAHLFSFMILFIPELLYLYRLIKREQIHIVHCNNSRQYKGVIAGKLSRAKTVWHLQDTRTPKVVKAIFKVLAYLFCDGFIVAGKKTRDYYLSGGCLRNKPIAEIQAPVDTVYFNPEEVQEDKTIGRNPSLKILTVGNINPAKGFEYFIAMAYLLNNKFKDLSFFIVGPHISSQMRYSKKILALASNFNIKNLKFYGPSDNVPSILKATDIYVCSSVAEASPISVWEAMSMAKPIVSTDVGDGARFIKDGENGFVVPIKDPAALAEKVSVLIQNGKLRKQFGEKAREVACKYLDVEICVKRHAEFYEIISEH